MSHEPRANKKEIININTQTPVIEIAKKAHLASQSVSKLSSKTKNYLLQTLCEQIDENRSEVIFNNKIDLDNLSSCAKESFRDRLTLDLSLIHISEPTRR